MRAVTMLGVVLAAAGMAQADVLHMGGVRDPITGVWTGLASIETVTVGDPGNAGELSGAGAGSYGPGRICGAVAYAYNIGKYEVTAGQYNDFLNAVAKTDTYALYNTSMWSDTAYGCKIQRSGTSGSYTYRVADNYANLPVNYVSWGDAVRFANWLSNGQKVGGQDASTTERGVYTLDGAMSDEALLAVTVPDAATRAAWASGTTSRWLLTSEDEWYKAAYYNGGVTSSRYWDYPTGKNMPPGNYAVTPDPGNNANFLGINHSIGNLTLVGEFENTPSPYGTFDQGGNVWEWNESIIIDPYGTHLRALRGGGFHYSTRIALLAGYRDYAFHPSSETDYSGFRVAQVPEPASLALLTLGGLAVVRIRRGRLHGTGLSTHQPRRRKAMRFGMAIVTVGVLALAGAAGAQTHAPWPTNWNNWSDPALWCAVGDPGNAGQQSELEHEDTTYYGGVAYRYSIAKFEMTAGQYTAFLNAVATTDTYGLYNPNMDTAVNSLGCNIKRSGSSGSYVYSVASDWANRPANYVSWGDVARFCNWLTKGQPTGLQNASTTEDGSYFLNGATSNAALMAVTRKTEAQGGRYYIPTENEWYKAAYYKGGGTNAGYWDYATGGYDAPGRNIDDVSGKNANYDGNLGITPTIGSPCFRTLVGEFENSPSPYGTFDQCGNVWEWNDLKIGAYRCMQGGSYVSSVYQLPVWYRGTYNLPTYEDSTIGFRVVQVPEPASMALMAVGALAILRKQRQR
ncbi:MAG: SUMF1/EgtB/PvdO family nonheme iron enzyme [Planctomycetota bacterium]|nr:SUMF1/EgtB/PvdO family nonheme iron enzyme [Planctomycetota bacterium]